MAKRIVIDLEMCSVKKLYRNEQFPFKDEIIQVGAVMIDDRNQIVSSFSSYVRPERGVVNGFIERLTGIREADVKTARPLKEVLLDMMNWIGSREVTFYAWSETDYCQLRKEIICKGLEPDEFSALTNPANWVDYQKIAGKRLLFTRSLSLKDALFYTELEPEGRLHDGLADAINTARLIEIMENNPDRTFLKERIIRCEQDSVQLGTSLGGLLAGLTLQTA